MVQIRELQKDDISALQSIKNHPESVFNTYLERGTLMGLFADETLVGFVFYNAVPKYPLYQRLGIPEIQDLNIHPDHRRQGFAKQLIAACEDRARREGHTTIGISVGLSYIYGPAQILYARLGYLPDGQGVSYNRGQVPHGQAFPVDDDLCLMLWKELS